MGWRRQQRKADEAMAKHSVRVVGGMITDRGIVAVETIEFKAGDIITDRYQTRTVESVGDYAVKYTNGQADPIHVLSGLISIGHASRKAGY